ncbi:MAG: hypothetical protein GC157_13720 [Frankiales bacterium]|nr:hypothetical protein [Frankiales bacterium]
MTHTPSSTGRGGAAHEPLRPRGPDDPRDERLRREREHRDRVADDGHEPVAGDERESGYTTEREQGAAQPGPARPDSEEDGA